MFEVNTWRSFTSPDARDQSRVHQSHLVPNIQQNQMSMCSFTGCFFWLIQISNAFRLWNLLQVSWLESSSLRVCLLEFPARLRDDTACPVSRISRNLGQLYFSYVHFEETCVSCVVVLKKAYPAGNQHIPHQGTFEDDFPFPKVGYVSSLESNCWVVCSLVV